ncbi:glycosyltransferase [Mucilaginibacter sp. Bleaf8]|uniref:glycosyltransferase n=1 Tax=Mucilaginibacter sp. Bleaf8 TaxID=2834430 RepID=UPI001BD07642|nr:glycosyltransferase [Mucilaginibacter sp. Bleaf8]MBS7566828.1 glycosyltransferase [Mucilaginibacter sp. Bleaf8]
MDVKFYHRFFKPADLDSLPHHFFYAATDLEKHGINVSICNDSSAANRIWRGIKLAIKLTLGSKPYQALYASTANGLEVLVLLRCLGLFTKPIVVWQHRALKASGNAVVKRLLKLYYSGFDKMFMFSEMHIQESVAPGVIAADKLQFMKWGPDLAYYDRIINKEKQNLPGKPEKYYCSTGRENRDFPTLIKAFEQSPGHQLKLFTTRQHGHMNNEKILSEANKGAPNIEVNIVEGDASVNAYLSKVVYHSYCMAICAHEHNYTVGLTSLYEAMALGKAIITSNNPYFPIDVEKEGIGLKVAYGDSAAFSNAVKYLSEHEDVATSMGKKARKLVEQHYNLELLAHDVAQTLNSLSKRGYYQNDAVISG